MKMMRLFSMKNIIKIIGIALKLFVLRYSRQNDVHPDINKNVTTISYVQELQSDKYAMQNNESS
ncbi:hypothetical protein CW304_20795 [Bacillus sp. UFRGS-B20]|nr:hypothetical protein CW304_20795 [Bacillus sp. UFRGS-B20]